MVSLASYFAGFVSRTLLRWSNQGREQTDSGGGVAVCRKHRDKASGHCLSPFRSPGVRTVVGRLLQPLESTISVELKCFITPKTPRYAM